LITFEAVTKRYPDGTVAVDGLDLEVPAGKTVVLVGPSGCGKTTTLRMINRLVEPTHGTILLDGTDIKERNPAHLRRGIGYVIQQTGLFPHRTVEDNIATVPVLNGWPRKKARGRADELLTLVGLDPALAKRYPHQLSGGQQQRVGVARALAADPPVLLMDEPFSAVDPVVRASLQDQLLSLQAELRKTIVLVTHDIEEAIKVGDLVALFRPHGKIAQLAPPEELLAAPVDDYVADFVGFDRGIRRLSFVSTTGLNLDTSPLLPAESTVADALASGRGLEHVEFCERVLRGTPPEELNPPPALTGDDLIALGLKPGRDFKRLLEAVREAQLEGRLRTKEEALALVRQLCREWGIMLPGDPA